MKRIGISAVIFALIAGSSTYSASAAIKAGSTCKTKGESKVSGNKKFTCIKSKGKLVWGKGVLVSKPDVTPKPSEESKPKDDANPQPSFDATATYSTDGGYLDDLNGPCANDPKVPMQWLGVQEYFQSYHRCAGQLRIGKYELGKERPKTSYSPASNFSNSTPCKMITPMSSRSELGFTTAEPGRNSWTQAHKHPSPNTVIQLIPIYSTDTAQPKNSPSTDYSKYLDYVKEWISYSSDFGSNVEVRIPTEYIKMDTQISDYKLFHENRHDSPNSVKFNHDVIAATDPVINFSGANLAFIVAPAGTDAAIMQQAAIGSLETKEGLVAVSVSEFAAEFTNPSGSRFSNLSHPFWWIHELFHAGIGFGDHYGDTKNDINTEYGMGWWTMMTPWGGDLTTWEKWILGFMQDSQIQCLTNPSSSVHWIAPSAVKTQESKSIIVPINSSKAIIIESIRPAGMYYKIPQRIAGVLVYVLDLENSEHGQGMKISLPLNRKVNSNPFFLAEAPLRNGDSTISNGIKITVLEAGNFGDVVKIEKV